jgi:hypothetical protein
MQSIVRYEGKWYVVVPKLGEPERVTREIAWMKIKENKGYREWFEKERKISKVLYNE